MNLLEYIIRFFKYLNKHKSKVFVFIVAIFTFTFLLFPFDELGDLVGQQISKATNNQVYLQFQNMDISLLPTPALNLNQVYLETAFAPTLTTQELLIRPSLWGMIRQQPYGTIKSKGFLSGQIETHVNSGTKTESGTERHQIKIQASEMNLNDLKKILSLNFDFSGQADLNAEIQSDFEMKEQPEGDFTLHVKKLDIPTNSINMGGDILVLPDLVLSDVKIKGRLTGGQLIIEEGQIGNNKDDLYGQIKGNLGLNMSPTLRPLLSSYSFNVDLTATSKFQNKASLFLMFLDSTKTAAAGGNTKYTFKISAPSFSSPPDIKAVR